MPWGNNNELGISRNRNQAGVIPSDDYARITAESVKRLADTYLRPPKILAFQGTLSDPSVTPATAISQLINSNQDKVSYIVFQAVTGAFDVVFSQGRTTAEPSNLVFSSAIPAPVTIPWTGESTYFYLRNSTSGATSQYCVLLICGPI